MKTLLSVAPGGPETLQLQDLEDPVPEPGEVIVRVHAAGVNFPDTLIIRDLYQFKPERPFAPGSEIAGVIDAIGSGVTGWKVGDRVAALVGAFGGFSTKVRCEAAAVMPIGEMPFDEAAAFLMTYGTSHYALAERAQAKPGECLLVLGAAGGVGSAAVEIGKALGLRVVAAVSSEEKAAFCRDLGADETVIYPTDLEKDGQRALGKALKAACPAGYDVIYDAVGGLYSEPALRAIGWEGRYLVVGFPAGIPSLPLNLTLLKSCQIMGVFWGAAALRDPTANAQRLATVQKMIAAGTLRPRIMARFPLERGGEALAALENRSVTGKVVVTMP
ncbi:MAG: NADPH:quinone oxidoreductase family protein [Parvularcula sp.]